MTTERMVKLSAELYECRRAAKTILRADYADTMATYAGGIKAMGEVKNMDTLAAAIELSKKTDSEFAVICILAAAVELIEPSPSISPCPQQEKP